MSDHALLQAALGRARLALTEAVPNGVVDGVTVNKATLMDTDLAAIVEALEERHADEEDPEVTRLKNEVAGLKEELDAADEEIKELEDKLAEAKAKSTPPPPKPATSNSKLAAKPK